MRSLAWMSVVCLSLSCNGKGDASDTGAGDDDYDDNVSITCDVPQFELGPMSCGQLASAYLDTVRAMDSCNTAEDCATHDPNCETWNEVGCLYAVSSICLQSVDLSEFTALAGQKNCATTQVCSGCPSNSEVECVEHTCQLVDATSR
jgi:hypothetical protein